MAFEIAIFKLPVPIVTQRPCAIPEGVLARTVYRRTIGNNPCVLIEPRVIRKGCKRPVARFASATRWKEDWLRRVPAHTRVRLVSGG